MFVLRNWRLGIVAAVLALSGCGGKSIQETLESGVEQARQQVAKTVESVQSHVETPPGQIELTFRPSDPAVARPGCYAWFVPSGRERDGVLQLTSYKDTAHEAFPSVFVRAKVTANSLADLVGQNVQGEVNVMQQADSPVWNTSPQLPATITVVSLESGVVTCQLEGTLLNSQTDETIAVRGQLIAALAQ